jgi:uncharacterized membrane protein YpjA
MRKNLFTLILTFSICTGFCQLPSYVPTTGLVAWYSFSGNTNDQSGNGHHLTNNGAVLTADRCGIPNSAYYFDGNTSYLSSIDTFFDNGWQNYTISLWFNTDTSYNPYNYNHSQTMFNTVPHYGSEISMSWGGASGKVDYFYDSHPSNTNAWDIFTNNSALSHTVITTHTWTHVALVKQDTTYKMYINGVLDNTFHNPTAAISYLCQIYVGTISFYAMETFEGSLDDYGIWSRALSANEVWQLYNNNCNTNVPACIPFSGLVAWYPFNGNTQDETGNGHNLTNYGAVLSTDRCGNANSAFAFDGDSTFMMSMDTFFNNGWQNYSISLWLNTDTTSNSYNHNHSQTMFNTSPHYGSELSMSWGGASDKVDYFYDSHPSNTNPWDIFTNNSALSNTVINTHVWTHVALVKSDTTYTLYINGVMDRVLHNPTVASSYLCQVFIGTISGYNQLETFWGSLDDIGIWDRALSGAEVWQVYNSCCTPSGIASIAESTIRVYPNPAMDRITIKADQSLTGMDYTITDITGREIMNGKLTGSTTSVSIAGLSPALYFLHIGSSEQSLKFVKE